MTRTQSYVLKYLVGDRVACWWSCFCTIGLGLVFAISGWEAAPIAFLNNPLGAWFADVSHLFGWCVVLCGLLALDALHKARRWLFLTTTLLNMLIMLWLGVFYLVAEPLSLLSVWVCFALATLQALIFVRDATLNGG